MLLISLLLIALIAATIITEPESDVVEQEELIPIPVEVNKDR
jgi:hypothetical protein